MRTQNLKKSIIFILFSFCVNLHSQNYISVTYTPIVNSAGLQFNKCFNNNINILAGFEKNLLIPEDDDIKFTKIYSGIGKKMNDSFIVNIAMDYYSFRKISIDIGILFILNDYIHIIAYIDFMAWSGLITTIYAPKIGIGINL